MINSDKLIISFIAKPYTHLCELVAARCTLLYLAVESFSREKQLISIWTCLRVCFCETLDDHGHLRDEATVDPPLSVYTSFSLQIHSPTICSRPSNYVLIKQETSSCIICVFVHFRSVVCFWCAWATTMKHRSWIKRITSKDICFANILIMA